MTPISFQPRPWPTFAPPGPQAGFSPYGFAPTPPIFAPPVAGAVQQLLGQLMQALSLMAQGWQGLAGAQPTMPTAYGGGVYGAHPGQGANGYSHLAIPSDPQDFASYLQAQRLGGSLEGKTGLAQKDAIPGTRFGHLVDSHLWDVAVARNYVFQFAAYASDNDALSPEGMLAGARAFQNMTPDAKLFTQVASVFKGDINGGPGFYDNPGLKRLLESRGLLDLANQPLVGETDVQTIGAITKAINRGALSLNDIINSGTIDNMPRYQQLINYVSSGGFAQDVHRYDSSIF